MTPEQKARQRIDQQLTQAGWVVQDYRDMNISDGHAEAGREFPLASGEADYLLSADCQAIEVVESNGPISESHRLGTSASG
jgi:type I restriction enzyme R subunit